jgi:uncharacterized protein YbjT (DUF2867 family)
MNSGAPHGRVRVTGATGNVGRAAVRHLVERGQPPPTGRLFFLKFPAISDVRRYLFPLIDTAMDAGVRRIVFLSLQEVQLNTATRHHVVEKYLRGRSARFTALRPNFFMQNLSTTYPDDIRVRGEIFVPAAPAHGVRRYR